MNKIFLINLKKDTERLSYQKKQFKEHNLKFERINAVYGKDLSEKEKLENSGSMFNYLTNSDTMIGINQSHLNIYKKIVNENLDNVIIMEDDIIFKKNIKENLKILNKNLPKKYDIIHLGCDGFNCTLSDLLKSDYNDFFFMNNFKLLSGTWCYIISNKGAKKILKYYDNNNVGHIDRAIFENKNINVFVYKNPLVKHFTNNFKSKQYNNSIYNNEYELALNTPQFYIRPLNINFTVKNINYYYLFISLLTLVVLYYVISNKKYNTKLNIALFATIILLFIFPFIFYLIVIYFKYYYFI